LNGIEIISVWGSKRFNLNGIEIISVWGRNPQNLLEKANDIRRMLSEYDLKVSAIASPFFKTDMDSESEYKKHMNILKMHRISQKT